MPPPATLLHVQPVLPNPLMPIILLCCLSSLLLCCPYFCCFTAHPPTLCHLPRCCPPSVACHPKAYAPVPCCSNAQHDPAAVLLIQLHLRKYGNFLGLPLGLEAPIMTQNTVTFFLFLWKLCSQSQKQLAWHLLSHALSTDPLLLQLLMACVCMCE